MAINEGLVFLENLVVRVNRFTLASYFTGKVFTYGPIIHSFRGDSQRFTNLTGNFAGNDYVVDFMEFPGAGGA